MSDFVVHFTNSAETLVKIFTDQQIRVSGPLGAIPKHPRLASLPSQSSCCLSEIPLEYLDRLIERRGAYGLGFRRSFIRQKNGARVWYLDSGIEAQRALFERIKQTWGGSLDLDEVVWQLTPFIDYVMPGRYQFEWEREWRVVDGLDFAAEDVVFVFAPESEHTGLATRNGLVCPLIDASWDDSKIQEAITGLTS